VDAESFRLEIIDALAAPEPREQLRAAAQRQLREGARRQELVNAVERLRPEVTDAQEDELLELLDIITGWCSPGERLEP
jgi:hypothetical protein